MCATRKSEPVEEPGEKKSRNITREGYNDNNIMIGLCLRVPGARTIAGLISRANRHTRCLEPSAVSTTFPFAASSGCFWHDRQSARALGHCNSPISTSFCQIKFARTVFVFGASCASIVLTGGGAGGGWEEKLRNFIFMPVAN